MKRLHWIITLVCGLCLLACRPAEPLDITRSAVEETAVTATSLPATWTPAPTATQTPLPTTTSTVVPTETPLPAPATEAATSTPIPTATLAATATPETTLLTPIQKLDAGQTLAINHSLLFTSHKALQIWEPQSGRVTSLLTVANDDWMLSGWRVSPDGQTVLIAQIPAQEWVAGFKLFVFDAQSRQVRELWSEGERFLFGYALAVDGRSAAFLTSTGSLAADETVEEIHVIDNETREVRKLADCPNSRLIKHGTTSFIYKSRCYRLVAGLDGQTWLWSDIEGVWQGALDQPARFLLAHDYFDNDPPRTYDPTDDWSPDGRYQLLLSRRGEGTNRWVLDMDSGQTIELPLYANSFNRYGQWQWTPDNHLLALREPLFEGEEDNFAELWHVEGGELVQDESLVLPNDHTRPAVALTQLGSGRFAFIINHTDATDAASRNLYIVNNFDQPPQPLVSLPPLLGNWDDTLGQTLAWTPDAKGILYTVPTPDGRQPFYIPADGSILYDLTNLLRDDMTNQLWLP